MQIPGLKDLGPEHYGRSGPHPQSSAESRIRPGLR